MKPEHEPAPDPEPVAGPQPDRRNEPPRLRSEQLFAGASEVLIEHRGATYRLKRTSLGKLILTK